MSTHNICFPGEVRKILCGYPILSVAMSIGCKCLFLDYRAMYISVLYVMALPLKFERVKCLGLGK